MRINIRFALAVATIALIVSPFMRARSPTIRAQEVDPGIAATGLINPRGFIWDAEGTLIVAEAGGGGTTEGNGEATVPPPAGPYTGGKTARVVAVDSGCPKTLSRDLPSAQSATGEIIGVADVAFLDGQLYALVAGGGDAHGNPDQPAGLYSITDDGTLARGRSRSVAP